MTKCMLDFAKTFRFTPQEDFDKVQHRTMIMESNVDTAFSRVEKTKSKELFPEVKVKIFEGEGTGHLSITPKRSEFLEELRAFITAQEV